MMKRHYKYLPNKEVLQLIEEQIGAGRTVRLPVRGNSMNPLLLDRRDTVLLHPVDPQQIGVGDVILYRWKDSFLMHRVVEMKGETQTGASRDDDGGASHRAEAVKWFICRGDALQNTESVQIEDFIALAELPAHNPLKLLVRMVWGWLGRVQGWLQRWLQRVRG